MWAGAEDETQRLKEALREREAAVIRQEGENFLLHAQVKQLQQQAHDSSRDAATCIAQLGQALNLLESGLGLRTPLKQEVDRARVLVASARRCLRRLAGGPGGTREAASSLASSASGAALPGGGGGAPHGQHGDGDQAPSPRAGAGTRAVAPPGNLAARLGQRRSAPRGRDRSWGAQMVASLNPAAIMAAETPPQLRDDSAGGRPADGHVPGAAGEAPQHRGGMPHPPTTTFAAEDTTFSTQGAGVILEGVQTPPSTSTRHAAAAPGASLAAASRRRSRGPQAGAANAAACNNDLGNTNGGASSSSIGLGAATPRSPGANNGARSKSAAAGGDAGDPSLKATFLKQRELLVGVCRKFALLESEVGTLRDDVTRRDVIIHNLRQEVQQHQVQQLQQLQQMQEMQGLLQQQCAQPPPLQQQHSFGAPEVGSPASAGGYAEREAPLEATSAEERS